MTRAAQHLDQETPDPLTDAIIAIENADLPAPVYRTARRLLDIAMYQNGNVIVDRDEMCVLCGNAADGTMRSHLYQLANAKIIEYHTNHMVSVRFITWQARAEPASTRAEPAQQPTVENTVLDSPASTRAERAQSVASPKHRALSQHLRALGQQVRASSARSTPPLVDCLVDPPIPSDGSNYQTTNHDDDPNGSTLTIGTTDQAKGYALLVDREVGISSRAAKSIAAQFPPGEILRQIAVWLPKYQTGQQDTGMLITRFKDRWGAPEPTEEFKRSEFYRRHFPKDYDVTRRRSSYRPEEYSDIILG